MLPSISLCKTLKCPEILKNSQNSQKFKRILKNSKEFSEILRCSQEFSEFSKILKNYPREPQGTPGNPRETSTER